MKRPPMSVLINATGVEREVVGQYGGYNFVRTRIELTAADKPAAFLSVANAAEMTGLSRATIRKMASDGEIRGTKVRGRWQLSSRDVTRLARQLPQ